MAATLKVYADRVSQPARAIILFCKMNGIEFEEVPVALFKWEHRREEYAEINPLKLVPAIVHGDFKLAESHAILIYLASVFHESVADHWYPADLQKRAKLHSLLDWHHTNLRRGAMGYIRQTVLAQIFNGLGNPILQAECENILLSSLSTIESVWLQHNTGGKFLMGNDQPSIADLSLVCELMQLQFLSEEDRNRFLGPYKRVQKWIEDTKDASTPYFDEVHKVLYDTAAKFRTQQQQLAHDND